MASIVVDANCMKYFQEERMKGDTDSFHRMIEIIFASGNIAIDDKSLALQEYNDCCKPSQVGLNLCDWIADQLVSKKILMFPMDVSLSKKLLSLGVPRADLKWPAIALGSESETIVTEDIDLFDPKLKSRSVAIKEKTKERGGTVSKFLRKKHRISVMTNAKFIEIHE